jgi:hypothetical protein
MVPARDERMCCSSTSAAAKFAQSYSPAALIKAAQDPTADKNGNGIPDIEESKTASKAPGTGLIVDRSA